MKAVNKHAPLETRMPCPQPAPFINKELRKVVYKQKQLHNRYNKYKTILIGNYTENKEIWELKLRKIQLKHISMKDVFEVLNQKISDQQ